MADIYSNQAYRILSLYDRLCSGETLVKKFEADAFHVDEKTIQRDFNHIRDYFVWNFVPIRSSITYNKENVIMNGGHS